MIHVDAPATENVDITEAALSGLHELGLKVKGAKASVQVLVIDDATVPTLD